MTVSNEYAQMYKTFDNLKLENKIGFLNDMIDILFKSNQIEEINYPIKSSLEKVEYESNLYIIKLKESEKTVEKNHIFLKEKFPDIHQEVTKRCKRYKYKTDCDLKIIINPRFTQFESIENLVNWIWISKEDYNNINWEYNERNNK